MYLDEQSVTLIVLHLSETPGKHIYLKIENWI